MDKKKDDNSIYSERMQSVLKSLSKCKIDFLDEKEECKKIREVNSKLEIELKEVRELEKSHRYHLMTSREIIGNLQETVSQLVYLKRDVRKLKDEIASKDTAIVALEKENESIVQSHKESLNELRSSHEKYLEELTSINDKKMEQVHHEADTQIAQFTCVIEELRSKIKDLEEQHKDKMNVVVLEYEEKIQRGAAQVTQLQEQLSRQAARTDANIDAYRRRLQELEEKLKQNQFKQYLAQSPYPSQYESQVERPYSVNRDPYDDSVDIDPVLDSGKPKIPSGSQNAKPNALQINYFVDKTKNQRGPEKKGQFNITKKRKLYSEKEFQNF